MLEAKHLKYGGKTKVKIKVRFYLMALCAVTLTFSAYAADGCTDSISVNSKAEDVIASLKCLESKLADNAPSEYKSKWSPIDPVAVGNLPVTTNATVAFDIPAVIPNGANEILVYVAFYSGSNGPSKPANFDIYTQEENDKYTNIFYWYQYPNNGVSFNSDNMWFPLTRERKIYVSLRGTPIESNTGSTMQIVGYR